MKIMNTLCVSTLLLFSIPLFSQTSVSKVDKGNCREGESVEYCITHKKLEQRLKDPAALQLYLEERALANEAQSQEKTKQNNAQEKGVVYKIPIVFHVLHNGGIENISREQIEDALEVLNRDFRLQNTDANNVKSDFQGLPTDCEIEFVLATKAPNGQCFSGITRTKNAISYDGADGDAQVDAIVAGNDVYQNNWPGNKYLNVFICGEIGGAAGYTTNPSNWAGSSMTNGIWILHDYVGRIGTSSEQHSRALTHEVGHWLNLDHTWGPNNNPGDPTSCEIDDDVEDTPVTIGVTGCYLNNNSCDDLNTANGVSSSWTYDVVDNVENYMDYSYCSKMYTQGQKDRMRAALQSSVGGRNNLWTTNNLNATGANGTVTLCQAEFEADKTVICVGDVVNFTDASFNVVSGWNWTFTGAVPATSTEQNPSVQYNAPGVYAVTLNATDGSSSVTETKTAYIQVLPTSATLPFYDSFESYTSLASTNNWIVYNEQNNNAFVLANGVGATGTKSVKLANFGQGTGNVDELYGAPIDLSSYDSADVVTMSFKYAYRKVSSSNTEYLKVFASTNCGDTWMARKTISGNTLSSLTASSAWTPTSSDWVTIHITNITQTYFVSNFRYKFRFEGSGGNNIYLDDINIYEGAPSSTIVSAGISEKDEQIAFNLFPNPAEDEINISFVVENDQEVQFTIIDITGKSVQSNLIKAENGSNLVLLNTANLASGLYTLKVNSGTSVKTQQFVKH